jgi:hypothetical protein
VASSLKALFDITNAMKDVHDANVIQTKVFELTREIAAAQQNTLTALTAQAALIDEVDKLKKEFGPSRRIGRAKETLPAQGLRRRNVRL